MITKIIIWLQVTTTTTIIIKIIILLLLLLLGYTTLVLDVLKSDLSRRPNVQLHIDVEIGS